MAAPYGTSLSKRPAAVGNSDEIQLRIDPIHADFDEEVDGLLKQVRQLRDVYDGDHLIVELLNHTRLPVNSDLVAQEIESESKFQNDFLNQLQMTMIKAQAGVKNNMRRLNKSIIGEGSNHVMHVVLFALLCFFIVYLCSKFFGR